MPEPLFAAAVPGAALAVACFEPCAVRMALLEMTILGAAGFAPPGPRTCAANGVAAAALRRDAVSL